MKKSEKEFNVYEYLSTGFNPLEFLKICNKYPEKFTNYFEVIIAKDGTTYFAYPSHYEKLKELVKTKYNVDFRSSEYKMARSLIGTLLSKFGYLNVYYSIIIAGNYLSTAQKRALKIYYRAGLINKNANVIYNYDYQRRIVCRSMKGDKNTKKCTHTYNEFENSIIKNEPIRDALYNKNKKDLTLTIYCNNTDNIAFKYLSNMKPKIIFENDNYFTVEYIKEIEKLDNYEYGARYDTRLGQFIMVNIDAQEYSAKEYHYEITK